MVPPLRDYYNISEPIRRANMSPTVEPLLVLARSIFFVHGPVLTERKECPRINGENANRQLSRACLGKLRAASWRLFTVSALSPSRRIFWAIFFLCFFTLKGSIGWWRQMSPAEWCTRKEGRGTQTATCCLFSPSHPMGWCAKMDDCAFWRKVVAFWVPGCGCTSSLESIELNHIRI